MSDSEPLPTGPRGVGFLLAQIGAHAAKQHEAELCSCLNSGERETLEKLLARIAEEQRLRPGIHPGYRRLGEREGC